MICTRLNSLVDGSSIGTNSNVS